MLVAGAQGAHFVRNSFHCGLAGLIAIVAQCLNEVLLAELFAPVVYSFGNAIGVKREHVSGRKFKVGELALPILKETHQSCRGVEPAQDVVGAQNKAGEMSAVSIAEAE